MGNSRKVALKNLGSTFTANFFSLFVTAGLVLIVPKFIGIEDYSYWQLYILYVSFVGFLHFGWADGIYLRYGGEKYQDLNKKVIASQFWLLLGLEVFLSLVFITYGLLFSEDQNKGFIIVLVGVNCVLMNMRTFIQLLLQGTNRIVVFSRTVIGERAAYAAIVGVLIASGAKDFEYLVIADAFTKLVTLLVLWYLCRDVFLTRAVGFRLAADEAAMNIKAGVQLMAANIAGIFIIGSARLMIERGWDIQAFGKVSLALTIANLLLILLGAVGIVLYPIIKKTKTQMLPRIYAILRTPLMAAALGALVLYYPAQQTLMRWLPQYADSLSYIALLVPICVFELKMTLLISTFMKAMRKERYILVINLLVLIISLILAWISVFVVGSIALTVASIVVTLAIRATVAELYLSNKLSIKLHKDIAVELLFVAYFMAVSWYIGGLQSILMFLPPYIIYLFVKRRTLLNSLDVIRGRIPVSAA